MVFISDDLPKAPPLIWHFVIDHHPTAEDYVNALEAYFWKLVVTYATCKPSDGLIEAKQDLELDMGNLRNLVQNNIQHQSTAETIEIALQISRFSLWTPVS